MTPRKLDARHKIQLGGLVIMSGLRDTLQLEGDLQKGDAQLDKVAALTGALDYVNRLLSGPDSARFYWEFLEQGRHLLSRQPGEPGNREGEQG